jgi:hypothetical protein
MWPKRASLSAKIRRVKINITKNGVRGREMPLALAVGRDRPRRFRLSQRSDGPLVLDVLLDHRQWRAADGRDEVAVSSERRKAACERRVLGAQQPGGPAFQQAHQSRDPELRID